MPRRPERLPLQMVHSPIQRKESSSQAFNFRGEWIEQLLQVKRYRGDTTLGTPEGDDLSTPSLTPSSSKASTTAHTPYGTTFFKSKVSSLAPESNSLPHIHDGQTFIAGYRHPGRPLALSLEDRLQVEALSLQKGTDASSEIQGRSSKRPVGDEQSVDDHCNKRPRLLSSHSPEQSPLGEPLKSRPSSAGWVRPGYHPAHEVDSEGVVDDDEQDDFEEGYSFWEILQGSCEDQFARGVRIPLAPILRIRGMPMLQMPKPQRLVAINYDLYERDNNTDIAASNSSVSLGESRA